MWDSSIFERLINELLDFLAIISNVFEVTDKTGRKIRLTKRQWKETTLKHPFMSAYLEEIKETIIHPNKITNYSLDKDVHYYCRYFKHVTRKGRFLLVIIKYLNGHGFVIKTYFERKIK